MNSIWGVFNVSKSEIVVSSLLTIKFGIEFLIVWGKNIVDLVIKKFLNLRLGDTIELMLEFDNWNITLGLDQPMALILFNVEVLSNTGSWDVDDIPIWNLKVDIDLGLFGVTVVDEVSLLTANTSLGWACSNSNIDVLEFG